MPTAGRVADVLRSRDADRRYIHPVSFPVFIPLTSNSRYGLLGAMSLEIAEAFAMEGCTVNPKEFRPGTPGSPPAVMLWTNFLSSAEQLDPSLTKPGARAALVQFYVDHPLALWADQIDKFSKLENFRMCLPCVDGLHLLRQRFPNLRHVHCLHGVSPRSLCNASKIEAGHLGGGEAERPDDVAFVGSIHSADELAAMRARIPARLAAGSDEAAELIERYPWMPIEQALDVTLGTGGALVGEWSLMAVVAPYVVAAANRRRRVALAREMEGVRVAVYGAEAWKEFCNGGAAGRSTLEYRGEVTYEDIPSALARAKTCLAWGPTQVTHSFSERLLLSLAAGCATVADDRLLVRRWFIREGAEMLSVVSAADPAAARAVVDALLRDGDRRVAMATAGRAEIVAKHLWSHRLGTFAAAGSHALRAA
jgi:hypothetical protein